jgi:SAM-dependent methyltransferase
MDHVRPMPATDRLIVEQEFHDRQAAERAESFRTGRANQVFPDEKYVAHETWIRPAMIKLGDMPGKRALDYGCGHGMAAVVLARAGAMVSAFDLSPNYVAEARERAAANGVSVECTVADAEALPFPDDTFDAVWGNAILHHLDLARAGRELHRVMKPGAVAIFCEPWGGNPLLAVARRWLPYPGKSRTPDERPLRAADLASLRTLFPGLSLEGAQLLGMIRRFRRPVNRPGLLDRLDSRLLHWFPSLANWCRYAVIALRKPAS